MRICHLNRYFPGGQTTHADSLAGALARSGHSVALVMVNPGQQRVPTGSFTSSRSHGVNICECSDYREVEQYIRTFEAEVIHAHSQTILRDPHADYFRLVVSLLDARSRQPGGNEISQKIDGETLGE
jgi:hypothetical protein